MEAVQVGCGDATHLGRVVSLQWRQQRLADVEVSVLKLALAANGDKKIIVKPQSLNPCLELTLKLVATHPPGSHYTGCCINGEMR